ncbi:MAG: serine/threonine-protein kinase [Kofleriaceae bacterium]
MHAEPQGDIDGNHRLDHVPVPPHAITEGPFEVGGRYLVDDLLGGGDTAIVFGATHLLLGKSVAIKILRTELASDPDQSPRFLKAARAASHLAHDNIVSITDFGHDDAAGLSFLVMERLTGVTLDQELVVPMAIDRALPILLQISRALVAAHAAGIVHRDLKPKNVFLVSSDQVKVCDFGLARLPSDRVTATGTLLGAPPYQTPAPVFETAPDGRFDLLGFGATAYEMLTGRNPVRPDGKAPPYPSEIVPDSALPPELEELIIRCLAANPNDRPRDAAEVEAVLASLSEDIRKSSPAPGSMIGQIVGTHRLTRLLGSGGIGWVYQAEHPLIGTKVAIKILRSEIANDPTMIDRFVLEARSSSAIGSPHIPRFLDFGYLPNGQPYAVMEYLDGVTLASRLRDFGFLSLEEAVEILKQVASAMSAAHAQGIIHRDLKPDNLFLVRDAKAKDVVKVLDFGIAKLMSATESAVKTHAGIVLGTAYYCSPEQAMGLDVTPAADIYALGATAFEMLTGQRPFEGQVSSILGSKTTSDAPSVHSLRSDLPDAVERTIARMLERDPDKRLATMAELLTELEGWTREPAPQTLVEVAPTITIIEDDRTTTPAAPRGRTTAQTRSTEAANSWRKGLYAAVAVFAILVIALVVSSTSDDTPTKRRVDPAKQLANPRKAAPDPAPDPTPAIAAPGAAAAIVPAPVAVTPPPAAVTPPPAAVVAPPTPAPAPVVVAPPPHRSGPRTDPPRIAGPADRLPQLGVEQAKEGVIFDPFKD